MGWNGSMIIIQNPENFNDENKLLSALGFDNYELAENTSLDESLFTDDRSVSIGYFNNSIVFCEGFQIIDSFISDVVTYKERQLISLFPNSEILSVAFLSTVNFHGYALLDKGQKVRIKSIDADHGKTLDAGDILAEEAIVYNQGTAENGTIYWVYENLPDSRFEENQLLEDFSFEVAKRLLGVRLDTDEGDQLMFETPFKKYLQKNASSSDGTPSMNGKWTGYYEYGPLYGDQLYGEKVSFQLNLNDLGDDTFEGVCQDMEGIGSEKGVAKIKGFINDNFISFTKEYDDVWMFDEAGNEEPNDPKVLSSQLSYKGTYNPHKREFTGEWEILSSIKLSDGSISEQIYYGTWAMKKG
ncbi:MAG: hypothetical protein KA160_10110 [Lacibacter sp.]|nr:hypothetical protein [Lacibacter sp.]